MANRNINGDVNVEFTEASSRQGLDSGESVKTLFGKIRKWLSDLKAVAFSGSYNDLTDKPTIPTVNYRRWKTVTQGQKWSRIYLATPVVSIEGSSGILSISCTRLRVVVNATFLITSSHYYECQIIELSSTEYSPIRCRAVVNTNGTYYFEIYDTEKDIASGTNQTWHCCFIPILDTTLTVYTAFTDGSTIPSEYVAVNDFTTTIGSAGAAIKDISGSGTTYTATRQDGSTFTFTLPAYPTKSSLGLGNVDNTSDADKPISTATQAALDSQQEKIDDISEGLDCLLIEAALVNNEVVIQNTSDFTDELYSKYFSYTKPKFAILKLQITSNTYYYKALLNSSSVSQGNLMEASFITVANGEYIYNFTWLRTVTVGTPTVIRKALNLGS